MRGHVYRKRKPDGSYSRWYAVIDIPPTPTGRRRQRTTTHDTKRDATAWLARTIGELRVGDVYDTTITVGNYLTEWLDGKQALRPTTVLEYRRHISQLFIPEIGPLRLLDLRAQHIERVFARIAEGNRFRERPITPTTMRRILATLNSALNVAVRRGLIRRNPAGTVELPKPTKPKTAVWTRDEAARFLAGTADEPLHLLYRLLLLCGLRRGEAVGLQWGDIDFGQPTLTVRRQIVSVDGQLLVGPPKSDAGLRTVAIDAGTKALLESAQRRALLRHPWSRDTAFEAMFVFSRPSGGCYSPTYVSRRFLTLSKALGLPRIRLHDLRHTSATLGLEGGESLIEVSRRLGHSSMAITADVYAHISPEKATASAARLADVLDGRTT